MTLGVAIYSDPFRGRKLHFLELPFDAALPVPSRFITPLGFLCCCGIAIDRASDYALLLDRAAFGSLAGGSNNAVIGSRTASVGRPQIRRGEGIRRHAPWLLLALLAIIFLTGGGSRADIQSLVLLRPICALAIALALLAISKDDLVRIKVPLLLIASLAAVMALQLVPLPPSFWTTLPHHQAIAEVDALIGLDVWRPISISPVKTANSLASLIVPLAVLLLYSLQQDKGRVLALLIGIGLLSAGLGVVQLFADDASLAFFYELQSRGSPTGFFANRNHQAVFLACCVLISLYLAVYGSRSQRLSLPQYYYYGFAIVFAVLVFVNMSRAGLICLSAVAVIAALGILLPRPPAVTEQKARLASRKWLALALAAGGAGLFAVFALADRVPALARLLDGGQIADLRASLIPILMEMAQEFQPFGVGFGAFEYAYKLREPLDLLGPAYVNHAHNDWLQIIIEGGSAGAAILLVGTAFAAIRLVRLWRGAFASEAGIGPSLVGLCILALLGLASLVDYPLRVPAMMALGIIALAMFASPAIKKIRS